MKSLLIGFLMGGVLLLIISSCATVPTESLGPGEIRLLSVDFADASEIGKNARAMVSIKFEGESGSEITRACVQWSGYGSRCMNVLDYANGLIRAEAPVPDVPGSYAVKAYVYYVRNGKIEQSNVVETPVKVGGERKAPMK